MLLQHEDLEQQTTYTRELSRLLFRSFFGCGVVCGLEVTNVQVCGKRGINVAAGLALDCSGDPVYVPNDQKLEIEKECDKEPTEPLYVLLCRTEKCCSPRTSMCASDEDEAPSVCTRERDGFEICIVSESDLSNKCYCGFKEGSYDYGDGKNDLQGAIPVNPCYKAHDAGECGCHGGQKCNCSCSCVLLAQLNKSKTYDQDRNWTIDHGVRRFVRPVLMRDPLAENKPDYKNNEAGAAGTPGTASPAPAPAPVQGTVVLVEGPAASAPQAAVAPAAEPAPPPTSPTVPEAAAEAKESAKKTKGKSN